jgi:hypothetical protein
MKRIAWFFVFGFLATFLYQSCKCEREKQQGTVQTEKSSKVDEKLIEIQRFEKDLFSINIDSVPKYVPLLKAKYRDFFDVYNYKVIQLGSPEGPKYPELLKGFITDYYMNLNYQRVLSVFPDVKQIETDLNEAFKRYKENFPNSRIPRVYTCISGWNQSVFTTDTIMGIALDKYLGRECEFYEKLGIAKYMRYTLDKAYITSDCMRNWGYTEFDFNDSASTALSNMLYEGKIIYFVKTVLPDLHDSIVFGYTPDQLKWCKKNTAQMWSYMVEHKMLFSSDYMMLRKLFFTAPFTSYYTNESPGRATVWLGYKIIESYLKANKDVTLKQLMLDKDYQKILKKSNFQP